VGHSGDFGKITYASQTIICHKFVRGAYFSDGLDSLRQGVIRDDGMLQWEKIQGTNRKRIPERISVRIFPNEELYSNRTVLLPMQLGNVEMAAPSLSVFTQFTKKLQVFDLPFLFKDMASVERFQQSVAGQKLLSSMENKLMVGLGYLHNGMKQLSSNQPIKRPSDIVGKVFRIMNSDVLEVQFEAVDAIPLKKPFEEVFTLLQSKSVDGQENSWSNIYAKFFLKYKTTLQSLIMVFWII